MSKVTKAKTVVVAHVPHGMPKREDFKIEERDLSDIKEGELLFESLYISPDPYQRACLHQMKPGEPMVGSSVVRVIDSKISNIKKDELLVVHKGWVSHGILDSEEAKKALRFDKNLGPVSTSLGILGMPGLTAYFGLLRICNPQKGETVVVSGAAGAVGSLVGQIAKLQGCRVIGITGSDEKCDHLKELGFDETLNYKTCEHLQEGLNKACPEGIDCFFDTVGGEILDCVLQRLSNNARIALCGQVSQYNQDTLTSERAPRLLFNLILKNARMEGFVVFRWADEFPDAIKQLAQWIKEKKIKYDETIEEGGLEKTPDAFISMLSGKNVGKQLVKLSDRPDI
jgi:leukotriene B4 12-hydroxydehydrogenase/15-oxo-prostaglandin 13-reductase